MATEIKIKNLPTGYQSIISNGKHSIVGDEPVNVKGTDLGFSPVELVLAGIAMCKVATVRNVARRKGWEIGNVDADLSIDISKNEDRSFKSTIKSSINIEGELTEEQRSLLIKEADNCYVTRLVKGEWEFEDSNVLETIS